jgi:ATP-dependent Clp protease ATP-binding subunit ClpA
MKRLNARLDPTQTGQDAGNLYADLHERIVGQDEAIAHVVNIYQMYLAGLNSPGRPVGSLLFLGPTGSGKTRLVESIAESMVGDARAVIKIDCAEFQHSHEIAKLIGSPPGYLGHRETHPLLSQEVLHQYHTENMKLSFVLFDEIEKASDSLWNLLLGVLDKATLNLGDNRRVDFSRTLIFMTSNLGAGEMSNILRPNCGFAASEIERRHGRGQLDESTRAKLSNVGIEAARRKFTPEFMNRIDKVVAFKPLGQPELRRILEIELNNIQRNILNLSATTRFVFTLTEPAKSFLLREGTDVKYGARYLKRAIERILVHPLSNLIATEQVRRGDLIKVGLDPDTNEMTFSKEAEDIPAYAMVQMMDAAARLPINSSAASAVAGAQSVTASERGPKDRKEDLAA